jgi:signal transduction histidine kinase
MTPADLSDPQELVERAQALSAEFDTPIAPGFEALVFKASRGIDDIYELTYRRQDGSPLPAMVSVTALRDAQGLLIGYLLIGTDNAARKRVDEALHETHLELRAATQAAESANRAKSEFLSRMSHELRSPLNAILGFAQLMDSGAPPPTPAQKDSIDQILQAGWYLLELINEVLDLALIESGRLSLSPEPMALADVLADCQAMIEPQARKGGIDLSFVPQDPPLHVRADRTRVKQVFVNLLSNAIKYNRVGGRVEVRCNARAGRPRPGELPGHRRRPAAAQAGAAVPALQPPGPGVGRGRRHGHRPGGVQAAGGTDGRHDRRRQHGRRGQPVLGRAARPSTGRTALPDVVP